MINYRSTVGLALKPGREYWQRTVRCEDDFGREEFPVNHVLSAVPTRRDILFEVARYHQPTVILVTDYIQRSQINAIKAVIDSLPAEPGDEWDWEAHGWTRKQAPKCDNPACDRGGRLIDSLWRNECAMCEARSVLECVECGAPDEANYVNREHLLAESICIVCYHWRDILENHSSASVITDSWNHFEIAPPSNGSSSTKGHGGRKFTVTFTDGRVVNTDNLWSQGVIPEWFRDRFEVNARLS